MESKIRLNLLIPTRTRDTKNVVTDMSWGAIIAWAVSQLEQQYKAKNNVTMIPLPVDHNTTSGDTAL